MAEVVINQIRPQQRDNLLQFTPLRPAFAHRRHQQPRRKPEKFSPADFGILKLAICRDLECQVSSHYHVGEDFALRPAKVTGIAAWFKAVETMERIKTDFLFAQPSFASGAARVFDLWGVLDDYNISATGAEADAKAIAADWIVIGQDISDVLEQHSAESIAA